MYRNGRYLMEAIPTGSDLIEALVSICREYAIETAVFSLMGTVALATIGVYDPTQQIYVTHVEKVATEVLSCVGNVRLQNGSPCVSAKIILADTQGTITGGHLFSRTIITKGEVTVQELLEAS